MGLVTELQGDVLNTSVSVAELLRKALVISKKLELAKSTAWIEWEMNGYRDVDIGDYPAYRSIPTQPKAKNLYHGWQPLRQSDGKAFAKWMYTCPISTPIGEIEALTNVKQNTGIELQIPFPPEVEARLINSMPIEAPITRFCSYAAVYGILESVRNELLRWALQLEADGIHGAGLTFSPEEKQKAQNVTSNIQHFHGNVTNSQVQQGTSRSCQTLQVSVEEVEKIKGWIESVTNQIDALNIDLEVRKAIETEIKTVQLHIGSPQPRRTVVKDCLVTLRNILERAAATSLARALVVAVPDLLT